MTLSVKNDEIHLVIKLLVLVLIFDIYL